MSTAAVRGSRPLVMLNERAEYHGHLISTTPRSLTPAGLTYHIDVCEALSRRARQDCCSTKTSCLTRSRSASSPSVRSRGSTRARCTSSYCSTMVRVGGESSRPSWRGAAVSGRRRLRPRSSCASTWASTLPMSSDPTHARASSAGSTPRRCRRKRPSKPSARDCSRNTRVSAKPACLVVCSVVISMTFNTQVSRHPSDRSLACAPL